MSSQETFQRGTINVSEPFKIPCISCNGSKYRLISWHYQRRKDAAGYPVVESCSDCDGLGETSVVLMESDKHHHEFVLRDMPSVDNNFQGILVCKNKPCASVIMDGA